MTRSYNSQRGLHPFQRLKGCTCGRCFKRYGYLTHKLWDWQKFYDYPHFMRSMGKPPKENWRHRRSKRRSDTKAASNNFRYALKYHEGKLIEMSKEHYRQHLGNWCRKHDTKP